MWIKRESYVVLMQELSEDRTDLGACKVRLAELREQVKELTDRLDAERLRSDEAVDRLLGMKGIAPVSPMERPPTLESLSDLFQEDPDEVKAIIDDIKERGAADVLLDGK